MRIRFLQSTDDRITQSGTQSFRTVDQIGNFVIFLPAGIDFSQRIVSMADVGAYGDGIRENRFRIVCQTGIQKQIFNTIYQLMAVKKTHPEYLEKADTMLMIPDYFHFKLSGKKVQEY